MTLEAGTRFGPYVITGSLGAGGMGEVYRAHDSNLQRDVAIKILPAGFLNDSERRGRFEREARLLAALNHPNIGAIYGIEEAEGTRGLVLELISGSTLSQRIAQGSVSLREALRIARQIASALEAAHAKGIVHRDLKPANIMVADGNAKVLDFGIATISAADDANGLTTRTLTAGATREGVVVGTAAYMSPEQARGLPVDKRTDVWAFGCVLYEMLSGRRAYQGQTISDTIARILDRDPEWDALPKATSPAVVRLLQRCLEKDLDRRLHDIADARIELEDEFAAPKSTAAVMPERRSAGLAWLTSIVLGAVALTTGTIAILHMRERPAKPETVAFSIFGPPGSALSLSEGLGVPTFALSPDGRQIVFRAEARLWLRPFSSPVAEAIPHTEGATSPFWSSDGRSIAFFGKGKLKKIQIDGGLPIDVCDVSIGRGGAWNGDNDIIFATVAGPLQKVIASGGAPQPVTTLDRSRGDVAHLRPHFLPDGRHFLFAAAGGPMEIRVGSLDSTQVRMLTTSDSGGMYAAGHLLFAKGGNLLAQPLDPDSRRLTGEPFPIAQVQPAPGLDFQPPFAVSEAGALAYSPRVPDISWLTWFDRTGKRLGTIGEPGSYRQMALSPDGQRIAVALGSGFPEIVSIWVIDAVRGIPTRLTFGPGNDSQPLWSRDGKELTHNSLRDGPHNWLVRRPSNAGGQEEVLLKLERGNWANDWSRDGRFIVYTMDSVATGADLWTLSLTGGRTAAIFHQAGSTDQGGAFSPDGRWIAYQSNAAGQAEVFVRPFPPASEQHQVSRGGGSNPMWRADGKELYFVASNGRLMAADIETRTGFRASNVRALFPLPSKRAMGGTWHQYDVTKDGSRFLVIAPDPEATSPSITVVLNWPTLFKKN